MKTIIVNLGSFLQLDNQKSIIAFNEMARRQGKIIDWCSLTPAILELDEQFKTGQCATGMFRKELMRLLDLEITNAEFDAAWNAMLGDITHLQDELIQFREAMHAKNIDVILIIDSNPIHITHLLSLDNAENSEDHRTYLLEWMPLYVSYQHGCVHQALYKKIIAEYNIDLNETGIILQTVNNLPILIEQGIEQIEHDKMITANIKEWAEKLGMETINFDSSLDTNLLEVIDTALANSKPMMRL